MQNLRFSSTANRRKSGSVCIASSAPAQCRSVKGDFMSLHFQVYADFTLTHGKPQLVNTSISSTHSACTSLPFNPYAKKPLTISRIFPTLNLANSYIDYLHGVYKDSPAPPPVLDGEQLNLFQGATK
jgi:hypothetical protein